MANLGRLHERVEADATAVVDVGVVDRRHEPHVGRLEGIPEGERHTACAA